MNNCSNITLYYHREGDIDIRSHQRDSNSVKIKKFKNGTHFHWAKQISMNLKRGHKSELWKGTRDLLCFAFIIRWCLRVSKTISFDLKWPDRSNNITNDNRDVKKYNCKKKSPGAFRFV